MKALTPVDGSSRFGDCAMEKFDEYLRIKDAAEYLGVSLNTICNWDRDGRSIAHRHSVNNYRLFRNNDLALILRKAQKTHI